MQKNDDWIAIYSRKSRFTGKGESIGNQIELCKEYIHAHYGEAALGQVVVFEDEGFSGGNLNRPDFRKMMKAAREHRFRVVIVYRLDRISRNISDFSGLIEELSRLDVAFVSVKEQFDTGTPMGRAMMYIASVFSQLERETIAERIRDNMHELAKTGRWLGGTTPTGYTSESVKSITIDGKAKKACKLKLVPEEAENVKTIFDIFIDTDTQAATEAELIRRGIKTKNGNYYTRFSVRAILQNPVYMIADQDAYEYFVKMDADLFSGREAFDGVHGIMAYNRTDQEKGRAAVCRPVNEWIVAVGQHPGIIPGRSWVAVQEALERNKSRAYRKPRSNEALLTGLIYCSCGSRMYPKLGRRRTADGKPGYTYVCKMKERSRGSVCSGKNANGNMLDAAVTEQIKMLEEDRETLVCRLKSSRRLYTGKRDDYGAQILALRQEKEDTEKRIESLVDSLIGLEDSAAKMHVTKRIGKLNQECQDIETRIQEVEALASRRAFSEMEPGRICRMLSSFKAAMDNSTIEQKRNAVRMIVYNVVWDGENAHVVLFGAPGKQ